MPERGPVGFGRRETTVPASDGRGGQTDPFPAGAIKLDDDIAAALLPERPKRGHKGSFGKLLVIAARSTTRGRRCSSVAPRAGAASGS